MHPARSIDILERAAADFAELFSAGPIYAPVPSCPSWTALDLARHLGGIHRWAHHAVTLGKPAGEPAGPKDPAAVLPWFREGAATLVAALRAADPDQPCWSFGGDQTAGFWMRRQAHETTIHTWDAAVSRGRGYEIDDEVAADGLDEVARMLLPRQVRLGRLVPGPEVIELRTSSCIRTVLATDPARLSDPASAVVSGPASALLLLLWGRVPLSDARLSTTGDMAAAERLLSLRITP